MLVGGGDAALPLERHLLVAAVEGPVSRLRREGLCATDLALVSLAELNRHVVASQGPSYLTVIGWSWHLSPPSPALVTTTSAPQVAQLYRLPI